MNTTYTFSKVAHVVDIKLASLDQFLYNLVVLIKQSKISNRKLYCFRKSNSFVWETENFNVNNSYKTDTHRHTHTQIYIYIYIYQMGMYLLQVNNKNTWAMGEICSKLTIKTPKQCHWCHSRFFIVNFE